MRRQLPGPTPTQVRRPGGGYTIIEVLVYGMVLVLLLGVAYVAFYRCVENSYAMRRNVEDVSNALRAGERWRTEVRAAGAAISLEQNPAGDILHLDSQRGPVAYQFTSNAVLRRASSGRWVTLLAPVQASTMLAEQRDGVSLWRWELELKPRSKKPVKMAPLFTFLAVPERSLAK